MTDESPMAASSGFDAFYQSEFARIALVAGATCGDRSRGEDIAQEALSRAAEHWPKLADYDRPGAWVRRVAINLALNEGRRTGNEARAVERLGAQPVEPAAEPRAGDPAVWRAVDSLPPRQRATVVMHYVEDRPVAEIAELLDIAVSTATSHLHKARAALAAALEESRN